MINHTQADNVLTTRLSICIATYNRGRFIGATLDSILSQTSPGVELVIVDGASPDNTPEVVSQYVQRHPELHYYREKENSGADRDYDKAVVYATGEYCWLMTDDDVLISGAVQRVLAAIENGEELIVVNAEVWNVDLTSKLESRRLNITTDQVYRRNRGEEFFAQVANYLGFIGSVVIKRDVWLSRDRSKYFGSLFVHVGVIFQSPPIEAVRVIADPLIMIRNGNAMWGPRSFEIWTLKWPQLLWSFDDFSDGVKQTVCGRQPWWRFRSLLYQRALGSYTVAEFQKHMAGYVHGYRVIAAYVAALFPATAANFLVVVYYCLMRRSARIALYDLLHSRNANAASRLAARVLGLTIP
jgi:glycosyltransferase involved in cell wall biosynthesis